MFRGKKVTSLKDIQTVLECTIIHTGVPLTFLSQLVDDIIKGFLLKLPVFCNMTSAYGRHFRIEACLPCLLNNILKTGSLGAKPLYI